MILTEKKIHPLNLDLFPMALDSPTSAEAQDGHVDASVIKEDQSSKRPVKRQPSSILAQKICVQRRSVYELLKYAADELKFYYSCIETKATFGPRFCHAATTIWHGVTVVEPMVEHISNIAFQYDFDERTPGNGYRSIVSVVDASVLHSIRILKEIQEQRTGMLFRANHYVKELEAYVGVFATLVKAIGSVFEYLHLWPTDELFAYNGLEQKLHVLMAEIESLDQSPFFGRAMGFQFCSSLMSTFQVIGISLASYSLLWDVKMPSLMSFTGAATNLLTSGQYVINPEERAKRIYNVTLNADIEFCKAFWNLTEGPLLQELPKWFCPKLAVNEMWRIPGDLALQLETLDGRMLEVPPPTAHTGTRDLPIRVLSYQIREGMPTPNASKVIKSACEPGILPKSPFLLFHVHGGGFVATSTKTHEPYLRHWAKSLNCPVVSIDYSLAPENPYPRAAEEVYYAYAWVLANAERLGWTGERICFAGDSAGGLLSASTTLRLIKRNIRRLPDGLVLIYPAFLAQYSPSPSRLLSLLDPLLPMGIVTRCLAAYTGNIDVLKTDTPTTSTNQNFANKPSPDAAPEPAHAKVDGNISKPGPQKLPIRKAQVGTEFGIDALANINGTPAKRPLDGKASFRLSSSSSEEENAASPVSPEKAANVREFFHRQLSRTSGNGANSGRFRSQSDNAIIGTVSAAENVDSSMDASSSCEELDEPLAPISAVIPRDPKYLIITAANYDASFLDYLRDHEVTKSSFRRLQIAPKAKQPHPVTPTVDSSSMTTSIEQRQNGGHVRSQSTGSLATLTRASANFGQRMGLYVMDNLTGWFNPGYAVNDKNLFDKGTTGVHPAPQKPPIVSPLAKFHDMPVPKDPFLSPLLAPDTWLARFPRTAVIACNLDPLLDDAVSFAKRLKHTGVNVTVDLVDSLPHGFLNFAMFNPECREAARLCSQRMREAMGIPREKNPNSNP